MIFAFLFGLSMDYEVFMLSRMREAYDETGSTDKAIELGLARTGKLVTSAALILMFAFLVLSSSPGYEVKSLAIGLAAGIIFDATVIRALLVPALMKLLGDANWWMPEWLGAVLRIRTGSRHRRSRPHRYRSSDRRQTTAADTRSKRQLEFGLAETRGRAGRTGHSQDAPRSRSGRRRARRCDERTASESSRRALLCIGVKVTTCCVLKTGSDTRVEDHGQAVGGETPPADREEHG